MTPTLTPDLTLFAGAASYYAHYRPRYPAALFAELVKLFHLNGQGRLLDLGTGTGSIVLPLHAYFEQVVAVDPAAEMLQEAQRQAALVNATNITWLEQGAETIAPALSSFNLGSFKLVTIGRAFHWMQRDLVLERSYELVSEDGGLAILDTHEDPWKSVLPWKQAAIAVVKKWLGDQRRAGQQKLWVDPDPPHAELVARSPFQRPKRYEFQFEQTWTVESFTGYLYSTAFCLPTLLDGQTEPFEQDIRQALLSVEPAGQFTEEITASILAAWK